MQGGIGEIFLFFLEVRFCGRFVWVLEAGFFFSLICCVRL